MRTTNREIYVLSISSSEHDNAAISIDPSHRADRPLHVQWGLFFAEMLAIIKDLWYTIYNICNSELQGFDVLDKVQYYMEGKGFLWLKMKII